jgi:hypothetical protein
MNQSLETAARATLNELRQQAEADAAVTPLDAVAAKARAGKLTDAAQ